MIGADIKVHSTREAATCTDSITLLYAPGIHLLTLTTSIAREYWLANMKTVGAVGKVPSRNPNVAMSS